MDGDHVTGEPSEEPQEISLAAVFINAFPQYLVMGMTYDEYWCKPAWLARAYRDAWEVKQKNDEVGRWRQGAYIYDALLKVSPILRAFGKGKVEPGKYPEEPYPISDKESKQREEAQQTDSMKRMFEQLTLESAANKAKQQREAKTDGDD